MGGKALILSLRSNPLAIFVSHKILLLLTHTARRASRARGSPACQETLIDAGPQRRGPCTPSRRPQALGDKGRSRYSWAVWSEAT